MLAEKKFEIWTRSNGKTVPVKEMHFQHLLNARDKLQRKVAALEKHGIGGKFDAPERDECIQWIGALTAEINSRPETGAARAALENLAIRLGLAGSVHAVRDAAVGAARWPGTPTEIENWIVWCVREAAAREVIEGRPPTNSWETAAILSKAAQDVSVVPVALVAKALGMRSASIEETLQELIGRYRYESRRIHPASAAALAAEVHLVWDGRVDILGGESWISLNLSKDREVAWNVQTGRLWYDVDGETVADVEVDLMRFPGQAIIKEAVQRLFNLAALRALAGTEETFLETSG